MMTSDTITADEARLAADLMSLLHERCGTSHWDVPGCRAAIHAGRMAAGKPIPADELIHASVEFAKREDLKTPLPEAFADLRGAHWRNLPEHARTVRPSEQPKCTAHGLFLRADGKCPACLGEEKGADEPTHVVMLDEAQAARNAAFAERIRNGWRGGEAS